MTYLFLLIQFKIQVRILSYLGLRHTDLFFSFFGFYYQLYSNYLHSLTSKVKSFKKSLLIGNQKSKIYFQLNLRQYISLTVYLQHHHFTTKIKRNHSTHINDVIKNSNSMKLANKIIIIILFSQSNSVYIHLYTDCSNQALLKSSAQYGNKIPII